MNTRFPSFQNSQDLQLPRGRATRAFSLVELLVVMSIIVIIASFAVPAIGTILRGSQLTQSSQQVIDHIALARQMALSRNRNMQVRFYKFGDPETPGQTATDPSTGYFRALQTFEILDNGAAIPVSKPIRLPNAVLINESVQLSTLINQTSARTYKTKGDLAPSDPTIPDSTVGKNYEYAAFDFRSDGSTNLPSAGAATGGSGVGGKDTWFFTMHGVSVDGGSKATSKPDNYVTVQVDPVTGITRVFRPTAG